MKRYTITAIPGAGFGAGIFGGLVPHLIDYPMDAISLPGHDKRVAGPALATIADMAAIVRGNCDGLPGKSVILLGHSMGALVAMEAASHQAVAGLVLLGAAAKMPVNKDFLTAARDDPGSAFEMMIKWSVFRDHPQAGAVRIVLSSLLREAENGVLYADLAACNAYAGPSDIGKPAAVISGSHDKMASAEEGQKLAGMLGGTFAHIENCGHMMMVEKPLETAVEIKKFISTLT